MHADIPWKGANMNMVAWKGRSYRPTILMACVGCTDVECLSVCLCFQGEGREAFIGVWTMGVKTGHRHQKCGGERYRGQPASRTREERRGQPEGRRPHTHTHSWMVCTGEHVYVCMCVCVYGSVAVSKIAATPPLCVCVCVAARPQARQERERERESQPVSRHTDLPAPGSCMCVHVFVCVCVCVCVRMGEAARSVVMCCLRTVSYYVVWCVVVCVGSLLVVGGLCILPSLGLRLLGQED